jgi:hypothetical protein
MKIYNSSTAPNPRRVRVFLAEKGVQVPYEEVDIGKAVNRGAEFRKKNPLATVPVLELDDGNNLLRPFSRKASALTNRAGRGTTGRLEWKNSERRWPLYDRASPSHR